MEQNFGYFYSTYDQNQNQNSFYNYPNYSLNNYPENQGYTIENFDQSNQIDSTYNYPNQSQSPYASGYYQNYIKTEWDASTSYQANNESYNYSYNDSAYQTQLDNSNYANYSNLYQTSYDIQPNDQIDKKRKFEEPVTAQVSEDLKLLTQNNETNKRPKILKLDNEHDMDFNCSECFMSFSSKAKYLLHEFKVHKNGSSCVCPVCHKRFGNQANTLVHLRGHTQEKAYKCNQCTNAFYDSSTLKKHLRTHTGEKPYKCHLCTKQFTQSGNLKRHLLVHQKYDDETTESLSFSNEDNSNKENIKYDWSKYQNNDTYPQFQLQNPEHLNFNFTNSNYYDY
ncbi:unnamed protein product [Brachionus calyciflorus]|uniref:C2H2-type domain-containing protein n=1 Tax=Brachionus calyciflorus TaxID=104777 RepID=A0A813QY07_9BILA|nr:unnamed protein product [Brachionus calyciflorus]